MIRINLLTVERERTRRRATFQFAQKLTVACSLILVVAGVLIGWWYWTLRTRAADLNEKIVNAESAKARVALLIQQVQQFEQRKTDLEQRVTLIEQLRRGQSATVHLLDEISRSLPDGLWLINLTQKGDEITLEGRCLQITAVSDLVQNLERSAYFKKPVDSPTIGTERNEQAKIDIVTFTLKAQFTVPGAGT
jgi:type IV pilus assembly protein PilN